MKNKICLFALLMIIFSCNKNEPVEPDNPEKPNNESTPQQINLKEPGDGETNVGLYYIFGWVPRDTSTGENYGKIGGHNLYLSTDPEPKLYLTEKNYVGTTDVINEERDPIILQPNTKYYWKVEHFDVFGNKIAFNSKIQSFITRSETDIPSVRLKRVYDYGGSSFSVDIEVVHQGISAVTEKGACISLHENPTTNDFKSSSSFWSLTPNTTYYVRAYAKNNYGTAYSSQYVVKTLETSTMTDSKGNVYNTVKIGNKWWMAQNLRTYYYNNGDAIGEDVVSPQKKYAVLGYDSNKTNTLLNINTFGLHYSWYTITDSRGICPAGWRIPTKADYQQLADYVGNDFCKLASSKGEDWTGGWFYTDNRINYNLTGFSAVGAGIISDSHSGTYKNGAYFWTITESGNNAYNFGARGMELSDKNNGYSVRLVKDI